MLVNIRLKTKTNHFYTNNYNNTPFIALSSIWPVLKVQHRRNILISVLLSPENVIFLEG